MRVILWQNHHIYILLKGDEKNMNPLFDHQGILVRLIEEEHKHLKRSYTPVSNPKERAVSDAVQIYFWNGRFGSKKMCSEYSVFLPRTLVVAASEEALNHRPGSLRLISQLPLGDIVKTLRGPDSKTRNGDGKEPMYFANRQQMFTSIDEYLVQENGKYHLDVPALMPRRY